MALAISCIARYDTSLVVSITFLFSIHSFVQNGEGNKNEGKEQFKVENARRNENQDDIPCERERETRPKAHRIRFVSTLDYKQTGTFIFYS